ncbi:MAG: manganese-dependent inorganic pyrophosphatase [Kiritimatiellia bacterium]|jgi:manganese-dependent inorganic pyrophosphatase
MPVYVIGHKNPDTDAICAAIGYADLLQKTTRPDAVAVACGPANERTEYVLERAGVPHPRILMDARPNAGQLCRKQVLYGRHNEPFLEVYRRMQTHGVRSLPILNEEGQILGMLPLLNLLHLLIPLQDDMAEHRNVNTSLNRLRSVLNGTFQHLVRPDDDEILTMVIGAMSADAFKGHLHRFSSDKVLLVAGDRPTVQKPSIEYGVRCIIVTGGYKMSDKLLEEAVENNVSVLSTPHDTAMSALLIKSAALINDAVETDYMHLTEHMSLTDIRKKVATTSQHLFPVLDADQKLMGVIAKSDLINPEPIRLILVDHNEFGQAVNGADEADIIEVIDHHRLGGDLTSKEPIRFMNDIVGSTSTMIARMYRQNAMFPDPPIALCLAAGVISDTLNLQSPTTTDVDRDILAWLASYANLDMERFVQEFFASGSALHSNTAEEIINGDCKEYQENGWKITISQAEELSMDKFWERQAELQEKLKAHVGERKLDFACLMMTNITMQSSLLLTAGDDSVIDAIQYPEVEHNLFELTGIVSRKKQLVPQLMWILSKLTHV